MPQAAQTAGEKAAAPGHNMLDFPQPVVPQQQKGTGIIALRKH